MYIGNNHHIHINRQKKIQYYKKMKGKIVSPNIQGLVVDIVWVDR